MTARALVGRWLLVVGAAAACGPPPCDVPQAFALVAGEQTGPHMRPGQNCLRCHVAGGQAAGKPFSVGGTVFPRPDAGLCDGVVGVTVRVTDAKGKRVELTSNDVGNFWSAEPLEPPLSMEAERDGRKKTMPVTAPTGGCALCHSFPDAVGGTRGRIEAP